MLAKQFPFNPTLVSMTYSPSTEILVIVFKKKGRTEERTYSGVPSKLAHQWYYKETAKDCLSFYAKNIRKKFNLEKTVS